MSSFLQRTLILTFLTFVCFYTQAEQFSLSGSKGLLQSNQQILPVDEAFKLSAVKRDGKIDLFWQIEPGYYLYRHRLKFSSGKDNLQAQMPAGQEKTDEFYGAVEVYYEQLDVSLPDPKGTITDLMVEYQGCADAGICYPPEKRQIEL